MPSLDHAPEIAAVEKKLSAAWEFLSGESRPFHCLPSSTDALEFAEFSFFMPLNLAKESRQGGVAVLMQHGDAVRVAANMFGVARREVQPADLGDACAEVCNVFSDCLVQHFGAGQDVKIGLPRPASPTEYARIVENSVVRAIYQGCAGALSLLIVLYETLRSPS